MIKTTEEAQKNVALKASILDRTILPERFA